MIITNNHNLPEPMYRAIKNDEHKMGDYSASGLYKSPRAMQLCKRHDVEIEVDAQSRIWALLGTAVHYILHKGSGKNSLSEEYMETEVAGKILSGASDLLTEIGDNLFGVDDYKVTSTWTIIHGSSAVEWEKQLNTYAYLFSLFGFPIGRLQVVAILRDWQKSKAKYDRSYPQAQVVTVPIKLWTSEEQILYISQRIAVHEAYNDTPDNDLPFCTNYERWKDDDKYAVMKKGGKRAVRVLSSNREAETYIFEKDLDVKKYSIEMRKGEPRKCQDYCDCSKFCNQYCDECQMEESNDNK